MQNKTSRPPGRPRKVAPDDDSWVRVPLRTLRGNIEASIDRAIPWTVHEAALDLIDHQRGTIRGGEAFPTAAEFARRWQWSVSKARRLMLDEGAWSDPRAMESERWRALVVSRTDRARSVNGSCTKREREVNEPTQDERREAEVSCTTGERSVNGSCTNGERSAATRARLPEDKNTNPNPDPNTHERAHARDERVPDPEPPTAPAPEPTPEAIAPTLPGMPEPQKPRRSKRAPDADVARVWTHYRARCPERRGEAPPGYLAEPMARAIREHGVEAVELLIDWLATGDQRAAYLRDGGYAWAVTPWRPAHLAEYVDLARAWDERGRVTAAPANGKPKSSVARAREALQRAMAAEGVQAMPPTTPDGGILMGPGELPANVHPFPALVMPAPTHKAASGGAWSDDDIPW